MFDNKNVYVAIFANTKTDENLTYFFDGNKYTEEEIKKNFADKVYELAKDAGDDLESCWIDEGHMPTIENEVLHGVVNCCDHHIECSLQKGIAFSEIKESNPEVKDVLFYMTEEDVEKMGEC